MPGAFSAEKIGPVDVSIISFEGNQFNGDIAPALLDLQKNGIVRVLDLTFVRKNSDESVEIIEVADSELAAAFEVVTGAQFDLLSDEDLEKVAADLPSNSSALVMVWENSWAARLAEALRQSQAHVLLMERIPHETVAQAFAALDEQE